MTASTPPDAMRETVAKIVEATCLKVGANRFYNARMIEARNVADEILTLVNTDRDGWRTDFENAPSPCIGWCVFLAGEEARQIWRYAYEKNRWTSHGCTQTVTAWQPLPSAPVTQPEGK